MLHGVRAVGESVAHTDGNHGGILLYPRFRFTGADGREYTVTPRLGSTEESYGDGARVTVIYPPDHPERAALETYWSLWLSVTFFGVIGLFLAALGRLLWLSWICREKCPAHLHA